MQVSVCMTLEHLGQAFGKFLGCACNCTYCFEGDDSLPMRANKRGAAT